MAVWRPWNVFEMGTKLAPHHAGFCSTKRLNVVNRQGLKWHYITAYAQNFGSQPFLGPVHLSPLPHIVTTFGMKWFWLNLVYRLCTKFNFFVWVQGFFPWGVKRLGREADHLPPSSAVVNAWICTSNPHYAFMAWCPVKAQGQFYLF